MRSTFLLPGSGIGSGLKARVVASVIVVAVVLGVVARVVGCASMVEMCVPAGDLSRNTRIFSV